MLRRPLNIHIFHWVDFHLFPGFSSFAKPNDITCQITRACPGVDGLSQGYISYSAATATIDSGFYLTF